MPSSIEMSLMVVRLRDMFKFDALAVVTHFTADSAFNCNYAACWHLCRCAAIVAF